MSFLSRSLCSPREVHIDAVYYIFRYLQKNLGNNPGSMTCNPMYETIDKNVFEVVGRYLDEWRELYPYAQ